MFVFVAEGPGPTGSGAFGAGDGPSDERASIRPMDDRLVPIRKREKESYT